MKALAYLALAGIILAGVALYLLGERGRLIAAIERRLIPIAPSGPAPARAAGGVSAAVVAAPRHVAPVLAQAQVEVTAQQVKLIAAVALILAIVLLVAFGPIAVLAFVIGVPLLAWAWLQARARKRVDALTETLPLYIDNVRQLQLVGNSLAQALDRALANAPASVQSYFGATMRRIEMGAPVAEAMQQLADRLAIPEISMFAAAIRTNLRFGGPVSSVFANLSAILRERTRIRRELVAATSEAKVSSRVLIAMPLLAMILLVFLNPAYIEFFTRDPRGHTLAIVAVVLEVIGIVVIRRLMRLEF